MRLVGSLWEDVWLQQKHACSPQAGMWVAMYHQSVRQLISYLACHAQCHHQRSCSAFRARKCCTLALVRGCECVWYPRCHVWGKKRILMPFRNFLLPEWYSFQHFCGIHQSYALSQIFVGHEGKSEKGLFHCRSSPLSPLSVASKWRKK